MTDLIQIHYRFTLPDGQLREYRFDIDSQSLERVGGGDAHPPEWTRLGFQQCPHCPLTADEHPYCPVALGLLDVVVPLGALVSHQQIEVEAITPDRRVVMTVSAQHAVSSVMGLAVASSACPYTAFLKPMARFHLPLASMEETVFRAVSTYLMAQYFRRLDGFPVDADLAGLDRIYRNLNILNDAQARRLRLAAKAFKDAGLNALIILDTFAQIVPMILEDGLVALRPSFEPFLRAPVPVAAVVSSVISDGDLPR